MRNMMVFSHEKGRVVEMAHCFKCNEAFEVSTAQEARSYELTGMCPRCTQHEGEQLSVIKEIRDLCKLILEKGNQQSSLGTNS